jgi:hypothetical protein
MSNSINDIISKFENGTERYYTDPIFNKVIMMLYHGQDPLDIIDTLIKSNNEITEAFHDYMLKH